MKSFIIFNLLVFILANLNSQENSTVLKNNATNIPQEKIYLHFDKPLYTVGEQIWFTAYIINAGSNKTDVLSKIIYVELIGPDKQIINRIKLKVNNGISFGDFKLNEKLETGTYYVRAYSNWMTNFDNSFFYSKAISIYSLVQNEYNWNIRPKTISTTKGDSVIVHFNLYNVNAQPVKEQPVNYKFDISKGKSISGRINLNNKGYGSVGFLVDRNSKIDKTNVIFNLENNQKIKKSFTVQLNNNIDLQFFPEGGNLVDGILSKVAFKAVDKNGKGIKVKGIIADNNKAIIAKFESNDIGIGATSFTPYKNKKYYARILNPQTSDEVTYKLPDCLDNGYVLRIETTPRSEELMLTVKGSEIKTPDKEILITGESQGKLCFATVIKFKGNQLLYRIEKSNFPTGIAKISIYENNLPQCERLVFINHNDFLNIKIAPDKKYYDKREKIVLQVDVTDNNGKPVESQLSLSISDANQINVDDYSENIATYLLMSSELKGNVENPNMYFVNNNINTHQQLDNLLLAQGWRNYRWNQDQNNIKDCCNNYVEHGFSVSGKVTRHLRKKPITSSELILFMHGDSPYCAKTNPLSDSSFIFTLPNFYDTTEVVIQTNNARNKQYEMDVVLDPKIYPDVDMNYTTSNNIIDAQALKYINSSNERFMIKESYNTAYNIWIDEVVISGKQNTPHFSDADINLDLNEILKDSDITYYDIFDFLKEHIPGSRLTSDSLGEYLGVRNYYPLETPSWKIGRPLYLVNGKPIFDDIVVRSLDINKVKDIQIINSGMGVSNEYSMATEDLTVISIYTDGDAFLREEPVGIDIYEIIGFYQPSEFYSPKYDIKRQEHIKADIRSTLYWNPTIRTDSSGKANVEFFNSDINTGLNVVVEGIIVNGGNFGYLKTKINE